MTKEQEATANLDRDTVQLVLPTGMSLRAGDALIVRDAQATSDGLRISIVPERTIRETLAKIYVG